MPRPKESERKDIRQLVLDKSRELFLQYGFNNVTMRAIAAYIGVSPAAIYLYFKNKAEIIFELYNTGFRMLYERQTQIERFVYADPIIKLKAHGYEYIRFGLEYPEYYDLMFIKEAPLQYIGQFKEIEKKHISYGQLSFDYLVQNIAECQQAGYFTGHDKTAVAFAIWSTVHGMVSLSIRKRIPCPPEHIHRFIEQAMNFSNSLYDHNIPEKKKN